MIIGSVAVALHVAVTVWRLHGSYFFDDDFLELELARASNLVPSYLFRDLYGHVEPLSFLTQWLFVRLAGWNFFAAETTLVTESALAVAMIAAIAARSRTPPAIAAVCLIGAAVSWTTIEPDRCWSNGVQVIQATLLALVALWICAKPSQRLSWLERAALGAMLVAACACYNKALFLILPCSAARLFVMRAIAGRPPIIEWQSIRNAFLDCSVAIAGIVLFAGLLLAVKLSEAGSVTPRVVLGPAVSGVAIALQFGWLAGTAGLRVNADTAPVTLVLSGLLADAIVFTVVRASVSRQRSTIWLWLGLLGYVLAANVIISAERTATFGAWMMGIGRYHTDEVFLSIAVIVMAFGSAPKRSPDIASAHSPNACAGCATACIGVIVTLCQLVGGLNYPNPPWVNTQANRAFIESIERAATRLTPGQSVGDRQLPFRVLPFFWWQRWNDLSRLATVLPEKLPVSSWDRATHYLDDNGRFRAFADLPRRAFADTNGRKMALAMLPPIEFMGSLEKAPADRAEGWFNPLLAPREKVRIAIVVRGRVVAWAQHTERPDIGAYFNRGEMTSSGFEASLPRGVTHEEVDALAVIDNRIGVILPRKSGT